MRASIPSFIPRSSSALSAPVPAYTCRNLHESASQRKNRTTNPRVILTRSTRPPPKPLKTSSPRATPPHTAQQGAIFLTVFAQNEPKSHSGTLLKKMPLAIFPHASPADIIIINATFAPPHHDDDNDQPGRLSRVMLQSDASHARPTPGDFFLTSSP